jgi:putative transposon-encoded protein
MARPVVPIKQTVLEKEREVVHSVLYKGEGASIYIPKKWFGENPYPLQLVISIGKEGQS